jgi:hypothetical protein
MSEIDILGLDDLAEQIRNEPASKKMDWAKAAAIMVEEQDKQSKYFTLSDGANIIRFLPQHPQMEDPIVSVCKHWIKKTGYVCLGTECPICDRLKTMTTLYGPKSERAKLVKDRYGVRQSFLWNILPLGYTAPKILSMSLLPAHEFIRFVNTNYNEYGDVTDLVNGYYIIITKTGEGKGTRTKYAMGEHSDLSRKINLAELINLNDECEPRYTKKDLQAIANLMTVN